MQKFHANINQINNKKIQLKSEMIKQYEKEECIQ